MSAPAKSRLGNVSAAVLVLPPAPGADAPDDATVQVFVDRLGELVPMPNSPPPFQVGLDDVPRHFFGQLEKPDRKVTVVWVDGPRVQNVVQRVVRLQSSASLLVEGVRGV